MFDTLTDRFTTVFQRLTGKGRLSEADVDAALREVRLALLEADVNFKVARQFVDDVKQRAVGEDAFVIDRNIDVHVGAIRRKIGPYRELIETVRGVGYRFQDEPQ